MIISYPNITPSAIISFTLPDYEFISHENMVGDEIRRNLVETSQKARLRLRYRGINAQEVLQFIEHYNYSFRTNSSFGFPTELYNYPDELFQRFIQLTGNLSFLYNNKPIIRTIYTNIYDMEVSLYGTAIDFFAPARIFVIRSREALLSVDTPETDIKWEQISGVATTIDNDQAKTTRAISQGGDLTSQLGDLLYRVSLISNPSINQVVQVVTAPVSFDCIYGASVNTKMVDSDLYGDDYRVLSPIRWDVQPIEGEQTIYVEKGSIFSLNVMWDLPDNVEWLVRYDVELWNINSNSWEFFTDVDNTATPSVTVPPRTTFRIIAIHSFMGGSEFKVHSKPFNIDPRFCFNDCIAVREDLPPMAPTMLKPFVLNNLEIFVKDELPESDYLVPKTVYNKSLINVTNRPLSRRDDINIESVHDRLFTIYQSKLIDIFQLDLDSVVIG